MRKKTISWQTEGVGWITKERVAVQERWQNEWHDLEYQGAVAKAPPCP